MPLFFGDRARLIDKVQGRPKIGERETLQQMVAAHHLPARQLSFQALEFLPLERGNAAPARYAMLLRQTHSLTLQVVVSPHKSVRLWGSLSSCALPRGYPVYRRSGRVANPPQDAILPHMLSPRWRHESGWKLRRVGNPPGAPVNRVPSG